MLAFLGSAAPATCPRSDACAGNSQVPTAGRQQLSKLMRGAFAPPMAASACRAAPAGRRQRRPRTTAAISGCATCCEASGGACCDVRRLRALWRAGPVGAAGAAGEGMVLAAGVSGLAARVGRRGGLSGCPARGRQARLAPTLACGGLSGGGSAAGAAAVGSSTVESQGAVGAATSGEDVGWPRGLWRALTTSFAERPRFVVAAAAGCAVAVGTAIVLSLAGPPPAVAAAATVAASAAPMLASTAPPMALQAPASPTVASILARGLGYCVLAGSLFRSVPQIVKVLRARSTEGLSLVANLVELMCYTVTCAYNTRQGYPFCTYGEVAACWAQDVLLVSLILSYRNTPALATAAGGAAFAALCMWLLAACPAGVLAGLQACQIGALALGGRLPQILLNARRGDAGVLSSTTCGLNLAGNAARAFTSVVLTQDVLMLSGALTQGAMNSMLLYQSLVLRPGKRTAPGAVEAAVTVGPALFMSTAAVPGAVAVAVSEGISSTAGDARGSTEGMAPQIAPA